MTTVTAATTDTAVYVQQILEEMFQDSRKTYVMVDVFPDAPNFRTFMYDGRSLVDGVVEKLKKIEWVTEATADTVTADLIVNKK